MSVARSGTGSLGNSVSNVFPYVAKRVPQLMMAVTLLLSGNEFAGAYAALLAHGGIRDSRVLPPPQTATPIPTPLPTGSTTGEPPSPPDTSGQTTNTVPTAPSWTSITDIITTLITRYPGTTGVPTTESPPSNNRGRDSTSAASEEHWVTPVTAAVVGAVLIIIAIVCVCRCRNQRYLQDSATDPLFNKNDTSSDDGRKSSGYGGALDDDAKSSNGGAGNGPAVNATPSRRPPPPKEVSDGDEKVDATTIDTKEDNSDSGKLPSEANEIRDDASSNTQTSKNEGPAKVTEVLHLSQQVLSGQVINFTTTNQKKLVALYEVVKICDKNVDKAEFVELLKIVQKAVNGFTTSTKNKSVEIKQILQKNQEKSYFTVKNNAVEDSLITMCQHQNGLDKEGRKTNLFGAVSEELTGTVNKLLNFIENAQNGEYYWSSEVNQDLPVNHNPFIHNLILAIKSNLKSGKHDLKIVEKGDWIVAVVPEAENKVKNVIVPKSSLEGCLEWKSPLHIIVDENNDKVIIRIMKKHNNTELCNIEFVSASATSPQNGRYTPDFKLETASVAVPPIL